MRGVCYSMLPSTSGTRSLSLDVSQHAPRFCLAWKYLQNTCIHQIRFESSRCGQIVIRMRIVRGLAISRIRRKIGCAPRWWVDDDPDWMWRGVFSSLVYASTKLTHPSSRYLNVSMTGHHDPSAVVPRQMWIVNTKTLMCYCHATVVLCGRSAVCQPHRVMCGFFSYQTTG